MQKLYLLCLVAAAILAASGMELFNVRSVELDGNNLVATSNSNYAISGDKLLPKDWLTISVNGDNVQIITRSGEKLLKTRTEVGQAEMAQIESIRDEIAAASGGYSHFSIMNNMARFSSGYSSTSHGMGHYMNSMSGNDLSINMRDQDNFSISSYNLPFNWSQIFFNRGLVTLVSKDGSVEMLPVNNLDQEKLDAINRLREESKQIQEAQAQQFSNTMHNSMNMISNVFNNIMSNFPHQPAYAPHMNNMFGDNFPFGPNNSPFTYSFPGGAFAFAGRRR